LHDDFIFGGNWSLGIGREGAKRALVTLLAPDSKAGTSHSDNILSWHKAPSE
jgi:hypothetical protein